MIIGKVQDGFNENDNFILRHLFTFSEGLNFNPAFSNKQFNKDGVIDAKNLVKI